MNRRRENNSTCPVVHRERGQSIPLIALMVVVLIGMVGLSVDVGNTYAEERRVVTASNAAALAGMDRYLNGRNRGLTDAQVRDSIEQSLRDNGIRIGNNQDERQIEATYIGVDGSLIGRVGQAGSATPPANVSYIRVDVRGQVSTYFARVVGRPTLPVNGSAYAGYCPPTSNVYPLGVDVSTLDRTTGRFVNPQVPANSGFDAEWGQFANDPTVPNPGATWRRLYLATDSAVRSDATWVRWMRDRDRSGNAAGSIQALRESLTGQGNLALGFEEVPRWPTPNVPAPAAYPDQPNQLNRNGGDWLYVADNPGSDATVTQLLNARSMSIANQVQGQVIYLPVYSTRIGNGANDGMVLTAGSIAPFIIKAYNPQGSATARYPNQPYIELVYVPNQQRYTACTTTAAVKPGEGASLTGLVDFWPEYVNIPTRRDPTQTIVVLDVSGSMNFNFQGQGVNASGQPIQCEAHPDPVINAQQVNCTNWRPWPNLQERRVYVAKMALERLVRLSNMPGNAGYDSSRPPDRMIITWYNDQATTSMRRQWRNDPTQLISDIRAAGAVNNDPYRTDGGTNGAAGLRRAAQIFQDSATPDKVTLNGRTWTYKRNVLFITDGVSNYFLNDAATNLRGDQSNTSTYPSGHVCRSLSGNAVLNDARCQTTDFGGIYTKNGVRFDRPITQMVNVSNQTLKPITSVFSFALSSIPDTGLRDGVASNSSHFFQAQGLITYADGTTNVDRIIDVINSQIQRGTCIPMADNKFVGQIAQENAASSLPYPQVGEVFLISGNTTLKAPIRAGSDGRLTYTFDKVPQGTYTLMAYLNYRHPSDPPFNGSVPSRQYGLLWIGEETQPSMSITIAPNKNNDNLGGIIRQDLKLRLSGGDVCAGR